MKLTDDLPRWIAVPLRLVLYAFVMFILFNVALGFVKGSAMTNALECNGVASATPGGLAYAKSMVTCQRQRNGFLENLWMRPVFQAIDAMPNAPQEFVGTWDADQPRCSYRHTLAANGEFTSEPRGCSLSSETFHGAWGVYDNQMVWLVDGGKTWPPDINPMDVVDQDFFLLVERDGTRTRFRRVKNTDGSAPAASPDAAMARGYAWARQYDVRSHAACRKQWPDESQALDRSGCSKYVTEVTVLNVVKPRPVHSGWDDGTTTAQCVAEVHAHWDPIVQDLIAQGDQQAADASLAKDVNPALAECSRFDDARINRLIREPQSRLDAILERVKGGQPLAEQDKMTVRQDYPGVWEFPPNEFRAHYLATAEELFRLAGGQEKVLTLNETLQMRLDQLQAQGVGMVHRPPPKQEAPVEGTIGSREDRFVPMSRDEFRRRRDEQSREIEERTKQKNRESAERLTNFLDEAKRGCGGKLYDYPEVGMSDETFRNCTIHARVGGVTQIVVDEYESKPLRLYVFSTSRAQRVYSIDGVITAIKP